MTIGVARNDGESISDWNDREKARNAEERAKVLRQREAADIERQEINASLDRARAARLKKEQEQRAERSRLEIEANALLDAQERQDKLDRRVAQLRRERGEI